MVGTHREQLTVQLAPLLRAIVPTAQSTTPPAASTGAGVLVLAIACESYANVSHVQQRRLGWANVTVRMAPCPPASDGDGSDAALENVAGSIGREAESADGSGGSGRGVDVDVPLLDAIFFVDSDSSNSSSTNHWQLTMSEALGAAIGAALCLAACGASFCIMSRARGNQQPQLYPSVSPGSKGGKKNKRVKRMGKGSRDRDGSDPAVGRSRTVRITSADHVEVEMSEAEDPVLSVSTNRNEQRAAPIPVQ